RLAEPDPRPHSGARQLAQPGRDLLLDRAAQGAPAQQLRRPRRARADTAGVRPPLRTDRPTLRVEVHPQGPPPNARASQTADPTPSARRLTPKSVNELGKTTTKRGWSTAGELLESHTVDVTLITSR